MVKLPHATDGQCSRTPAETAAAIARIGDADQLVAHTKDTKKSNELEAMGEQEVLNIAAMELVE